MDFVLPTLLSLRYPRNRGWVRAVVFFTVVAWLVSALNTNCIKPQPSVHVTMPDCMHGMSMADMDMAKDMHAMEKCANKVCYTALASAKDGFSIEKLKLSFDLLWLPLAFFCAFLLVSLTQAPLVFVGFDLRRRRIPLIYRFCSLLN